MFPRKSDDQIDMLIKLAQQQQQQQQQPASDAASATTATTVTSNRIVEFSSLFDQEIDGTCGAFLSSFKENLRDARLQLQKQILDAIGNIRYSNNHFLF